ncbi:MAG TPA: outer membrane lipoprotein carrier protein LolA [Stellaceae bacterium]|nr:outer membrane lipoprotein carrier protein LolA [Stellaceae bacterium]
MRQKTTRRLMLGAGAALVMLSARAPADAAAPQAVALTAQDNADLQRIAAYLNGIHTMYAKFHQVSSDGSTAGGQLWMERPGRMRFEYDPPSPILLIADRFYVYYIDKELAQVSQVGLKSTPAWLLLRDPITFADLVVTGFERRPDRLRVTVTQTAEPGAGSLTMVFTTEPMALVQWTIIDQQRRITTVSLYDERFGMALDPNLFVYRNPYHPRSEP